MKLVDCFYIISSVFAVVCGRHIPDEKFLDEDALAEIGFPHLSHPYLFGLSAVGDPTFDEDFDLSPPPLPPLEVVRESRTRFRQIDRSRQSDRARTTERTRTTALNGDRGSATINENARNNNSNRNNNRSNSRNNSRNNSRSNGNNRNNNPTDTNELSNSDEDLMALLFRDDNSGKREIFLRKQQRLEDIRNFYNVGEIRKKREADPVAEAEPTAGRFRGKRGHCKKCGGGYGGGALPVYQFPVYGGGHGGYKPSYGGGCHSCGGGGYPGFGGGGGYPGFGGGYPGFGGGGGHSGSYSQSSSQSSSSSGSWGYGRK